MYIAMCSIIYTLHVYINVSLIIHAVNPPNITATGGVITVSKVSTSHVLFLASTCIYIHVCLA